MDTYSISIPSSWSLLTRRACSTLDRERERERDDKSLIDYCSSVKICGINHTSTRMTLYIHLT